MILLSILSDVSHPPDGAVACPITHRGRAAEKPGVAVLSFYDRCVKK